MIPRPLVEPFPAKRRSRGARRVGFAIGAVLCGCSLIGLMVWFQLTPLRFSRFPLRDGDRVEEITQAGTYFVFEEHSGAAEPALPPPLTVAVYSKAGDVVPVEQLIRPNTLSSPMAYRTPWSEGRAIARFTIDNPGQYHVRSVPLRRGSSAGYGPRTGGALAIGQEISTTWIGSWEGLLLLAGLPLAMGITTIVISRRRARHRPRTRPVVPAPGDSVVAHG